MQKNILIVGLLAIILTTSIGYVHAQNEDPVPNDEPEIAFSEFQIIVIGIGALAGLVTAYNGYSKNKTELGDAFKFDRKAFLDRVLMAVLGSIPLAVMESANIVKLDIFGAWIIFISSLGTAQLILEIRTRNKGKK